MEIKLKKMILLIMFCLAENMYHTQIQQSFSSTTVCPFQRIISDIVGLLVKSSSVQYYILVVCDYATRFPEAFPLRTISAPAYRLGYQFHLKTYAAGPGHLRYQDNVIPPKH